MKPLRLSLQAFGPFADKQEVDFRLLGENPLFLINGPTGAGKSSILDAICFALYGKTTADEREASAMRCDQAQPMTLTEVSLDFTLGGKYYRVNRAPQQQRPKARGEGFTTDNGYATLWQVLENGELKLIVAKKVKEVTSEIESITGLNVEQFRQVMVLPQGKFRELLLADSRDREKIFGQLFQTNIYKRIEEELRQQASIIQNDVKSLHDQIKGILHSAELNNEDEIDSQLDLLKPDLKKLVVNKENAQKLYQEALKQKDSALALLTQFEELEASKKNLSELQKLQPQIQTEKEKLDKATLAEKNKPLFDETLRIKSEYCSVDEELISNGNILQQAKKAYDIAQSDFEKAKKSFKAVDQLKQKQHVLLRYEEKIVNLSEANKSASQAQEKYDYGAKKSGQLQQEINSQNLEKERLIEELLSLQKAVSALAFNTLKLDDISRLYALRKKLELAEKAVKSMSADLISAQKQLVQSSKNAELSQQAVKTQEMLWHAGQAVSLAKELQPDKPCPVCGSNEHPSPALVDNNDPIVSQQQVEDARIQAEKEMAKKIRDEKLLGKIELELKQLQKEITDHRQVLGEFSGQSVKQLESSVKSLQSEIKLNQQKKNRLDVVDKNLSSIQVETETLQLKLMECSQQNEMLKKEAFQKQAAVTILTKEIPQEYHNRQILQEQQQQLSTTIEQLSGKLESATEQAEQTRIKLTEVDTQSLSLKKQKTILSEKLTHSKVTWMNALNQSVFVNEDDYKLSILTENDKLLLKDRIDKYDTQVTQFMGAIKQQKNSLKNKVVPDMDSLDKDCKQQLENYQQIEKEWHELDSRVKQLKSVHKKLKKAHEENTELEAEYAIYGTLSDVANGRTSNKISLQRFVLSVLLDDVLIQASQRLRLMSKGRYQLLRKDARAKGNLASGLELDVEDAYTGKTRSVATLSGGESFMAALALALGLSDVVQAYAGGVKLDMLFIDEGFGSLDQESLDLAIRTLIDLQSTGRMIGIISHVTELKEQIQLRLDVVSSNAGSTIKTIST